VGTEEWIDGALAGNLGEVLIRCNNVLFVRAANGKGEAQKKRRTEDEDD
jgi:small nuclear ribonucleoprotein F